jgi:hypothetical protein
MTMGEKTSACHHFFKNRLRTVLLFANMVWLDHTEKLVGKLASYSHSAKRHSHSKDERSSIGRSVYSACGRTFD